MANTLSLSFSGGKSREPIKMVSEISEHANELMNKASGYGQRIADAIDDKRLAAAGGLDRTAATLHAKADNLPGVETLSGLAHDAAEKLSSTAGYMREHDVRGVMNGMGATIKRNPGPSILAAAVVGFLLGWKFSGSTRQ
ncbi:MAG: hypothetical protein KIT83_15640 [Bryobacterales bacterium]|nr:hypothetical protein [Bryobacterales bacterium]